MARRDSRRGGVRVRGLPRAALQAVSPARSRRTRKLSLGALRPEIDGAPDRSRTCDLWLRKPTLYPTELRAHDRGFYRAARRRVHCTSRRPGGEAIICVSLRGRIL